MTQSSSAVTKLRLTEDPIDPRWGLAAGRPAACRIGLLGWVRREPPIDAGVPDETAHIIARSLCRSGKVTFLSSASPVGPTGAWRATAEGWLRTLSPRNQVLPGRARPLPLLCTVQPEVVVRLFDDAQFPWVLGAQLALISPVDSPPPDLSFRALEHLANHTRSIAALRRMGTALRGIMHPGPDGDFASFITQSDVEWKQLREHLVDESAACGLCLEIVSEAEFLNTRWFTGESS